MVASYTGNVLHSFLPPWRSCLPTQNDLRAQRQVRQRLIMNRLVPESLYQQPLCLQSYDSRQKQQAIFLLIWQLNSWPPYLDNVTVSQHSELHTFTCAEGNFHGVFTIQRLPGPSWRRQRTSLVKQSFNRPPAPHVLVIKHPTILTQPLIGSDSWQCTTGTMVKKYLLRLVNTGATHHGKWDKLELSQDTSYRIWHNTPEIESHIIPRFQKLCAPTHAYPKNI